MITTFKIIVFFFSLVSSVNTIEGTIKNIIIKNVNNTYVPFTWGILMIILWTAFYILNQF